MWLVTFAFWMQLPVTLIIVICKTRSLTTRNLNIVTQRNLNCCKTGQQIYTKQNERGRWREIRRWADTFCLHCNIFIYIRHIWIKPVLCSRMVSLFHHASPWTHRCLESSPTAHRKGRAFRRSVQTACCYWILNRGKSSIQLKFTDEREPFVVISVLLWVQ